MNETNFWHDKLVWKHFFLILHVKAVGYRIKKLFEYINPLSNNVHCWKDTFELISMWIGMKIIM